MKNDIDNEELDRMQWRDPRESSDPTCAADRDEFEWNATQLFWSMHCTINELIEKVHVLQQRIHTLEAHKSAQDKPNEGAPAIVSGEVAP
jgi:hypothetical protein